MDQFIFCSIICRKRPLHLFLWWKLNDHRYLKWYISAVASIARQEVLCKILRLVSRRYIALLMGAAAFLFQRWYRALTDSPHDGSAVALNLCGGHVMIASEVNGCSVFLTEVVEKVDCQLRLLASACCSTWRDSDLRTPWACVHILVAVICHNCASFMTDCQCYWDVTLWIVLCDLMVTIHVWHYSKHDLGACGHHSDGYWRGMGFRWISQLGGFFW